MIAFSPGEHSKCKTVHFVSFRHSANGSLERVFPGCLVLRRGRDGRFAWSGAEEAPESLRDEAAPRPAVLPPPWSRAAVRQQLPAVPPDRSSAAMIMMSRRLGRGWSSRKDFSPCPEGTLA